MTNQARNRQRQSCVLLLLLLLLAPMRAQAHGGPSNPLQTFTQTIGRYDIAVTLSLPATAPAPLAVTLDVPPELGAATIELRVALRGQPFAGQPASQIATSAGGPLRYSGQVVLTQPGDWELEVQVGGATGGVVYLPFTIPQASLPPYSGPLMAALSALVTLLLASIMLSSVAERRSRPLPRWVTTLLRQGMFASLILAAVFGYLQFSAGLQAAQADSGPLLPASTAAVDTGRPYANVTLRSEPAALQVGQPAQLLLELSDGSTGLPLDDLVEHHEALIHLLVIDELGADFQHLHPARIAAGRYTVALTPGRSGRYTVYLEIERVNSGTQLLSRSFSVGGTAATAPAAAAGLGQRQIGDLQVLVSSTRQQIVAGRQTTLTASFSRNGQPVTDIQPWLSMAGHMVARSADSAVIAHVHAAEQMAPTDPTSSPPNFGPDIRFAYTFPQPGSYQVWLQFKHNDRILTVPLTLEARTPVE